MSFPQAIHAANFVSKVVSADDENDISLDAVLNFQSIWVIFWIIFLIGYGIVTAVLIIRAVQAKAIQTIAIGLFITSGVSSTLIYLYEVLNSYFQFEMEYIEPIYIVAYMLSNLTSFLAPIAATYHLARSIDYTAYATWLMILSILVAIFFLLALSGFASFMTIISLIAYVNINYGILKSPALLVSIFTLFLAILLLVLSALAFLLSFVFARNRLSSSEHYKVVKYTCAIPFFNYLFPFFTFLFSLVQTPGVIYAIFVALFLSDLADLAILIFVAVKITEFRDIDGIPSIQPEMVDVERVDPALEEIHANTGAEGATEA